MRCENCQFNTCPFRRTAGECLNDNYIYKHQVNESPEQQSVSVNNTTVINDWSLPNLYRNEIAKCVLKKLITPVDCEYDIKRKAELAAIAANTLVSALTNSKL